MKLVKGQTLRELLKRRRSPADDRSRYIAIFEQVCHAIGYAHSHHVLHRDLKPANVMVGAHGEVQVMDWGLAKVLSDEPQDKIDAQDDAGDLPPTVGLATKIDTADREDSATRTGQALGTPAYMPPEQAGGEIRKLDERSEVFGLGAILCEILTGKPPYTGKNAQEVLLKAVRGELGEVLERLEACTDEPELVALCRRCLAFDKADRPADGNTVAAEVVRIREAAQRDAERARQEALKRQQEAIAERDAKAEALAKLEVALKAEQEAKELEKEARTQAIAAIRFMTDDAVKDQIAEGKSHLSQKKKEYLNRVIEFYEGFAKIRGEREEARAIQAEGLYRVGKLQFYVGEPEAAQENLKKAADLYRQLVKGYADRADYRHVLVQTLDELSWVFMRASSAYEEAESVAKEAIGISEALVEQFPAVPTYQSDLALSHGNLASVYRGTNRYAEAEVEHKKAIELRAQLVKSFPKESRYITSLSDSYAGLADAYRYAKQYDKAEVEYSRALNVIQELLKKFPDSEDYWFKAQWWRDRLVRVYVWTNQYDEAKAVSDAAIADCEAKLQAKPESNTYQRGLAMQLIPRILMLAALDEKEDTIAAAERLAALEYAPKQAALWAAMGLSLAVRGVTENEKLDEATRRQAAETYTKEAIRMLELAIKRGYDDADELCTDSDFDPIRDRKDFQAIVERVAGGK